VNHIKYFTDRVTIDDLQKEIESVFNSRNSIYSPHKYDAKSMAEKYIKDFKFNYGYSDAGIERKRTKALMFHINKTSNFSIATSDDKFMKLQPSEMNTILNNLWNNEIRINDLTKGIEKKPITQPTSNYTINTKRKFESVFEALRKKKATDPKDVRNPRMEWAKYWEIISFKYEFFKDDYRLIDKSHPEFEDCISDCVDNTYKEDPIKIHSVRRLKDGEIFTIGDVLCDRPLFDDDKPHIYGKIDKIWPSFDQMRADMGRLGSNLNNDFLCVVKVVE